jgi:16S rRNA (cytosine1402-N4)-methyltransferase
MGWADARFRIVQARFSQLDDVLDGLGIGQVEGVLLDLGVSSPQLDDAARGFSFKHDGPLDMRMDPAHGMSASEWLYQASEHDIAEALKDYGEERFAVPVAKAIVAARQGGPIARTRQLADVVGTAVRTREPGQDPATRTFQALRIHLNQELEELSLVLPQALQWLAPGGRLAVISFHSLEDRLVKNFMRDSARAEQMPERLPVRAADLAPAQMQLIGKPQRASAEELRRNPRARSATLRVAQKLALAASAAANGVQH